MKTTFKAILRTDIPSKGLLRRIDIRIYFEGKQYKFSTPKFIEPEFWDRGICRVQNASDKAKQINYFLLKKESAFQQYILQKESYNERPSLSSIKAIITDQPIENSLKNDRLTLDELFEMYIKNLYQTNKRKNTIRKFMSLQKTMKDFTSLHLKKKQPTIGIVDYQFLLDYLEYLQVKRLNNVTTSYKGLKNFRSVLYFAIKNDYPIKNPFVHFRLLADARRETYLNFSEYEKFKKFKVPLSEPRGMALSKLLFVFACETGLRYSDVMDLKWKHIDSDFQAITKIQIKNGNEVYIPLSNESKSILNKMYLASDSEYVFKKLTNPYINRNLKKIALALSISKNISFHVARHTFGSHLGLKGMSPQLIMRLLGDRDMKQALTYINMDNEDILKQMRDAS